VHKGWQEGERSLGPREEFVGDVHFRRGAPCNPSTNGVDEFTWLILTQVRRQGGYVFPPGIEKVLE
jgi:hypothetical protein